MRKQFYFLISLLFWLFMVVGFADNWLYDVDQPSNSVPRFIVHGGVAFLWFTIVVVQTGLIGKGKVSLHQQVGLFGFLVFICLVVSSSYIYLVKYLDGRFGPLSLMVSSQLVFAVFLTARAYHQRRLDPMEHKICMIFANLWLIQPAMDRWVDHLFPDNFLLVWLGTYLVLFVAFIWYFRRVPWQLWIGVAIWLAGLLNAIARDDF